MQPKLGIDIGGVIIDHSNRTSGNSFFGENFLKSTIATDSFDRIRDLYDCFGKQVYLVSKATIENQNKTESWLVHNNFHTRTGIEKPNVFFCREHIDKKTICQNLGLTHFIDDKLKVLQYLIGHVPNLYLFSPEEEDIQGFEKYLSDVVVVKNWSECYKSILKTM